MIEYNRLNTIESRRRQMPCAFKDGISEKEFDSIAHSVADEMERVRQITINGAIIKGLAESHSGRTTWWFTVDFNNWGHITGTRWTWSQKENSNLAEKYGDRVAEKIKSVLKRRNVKVVDYSELIDADKDVGTIHGLNYKKKFWINKETQITSEMDATNFNGEHVYAVFSFLKSRGFCNIKAVKTNFHSEFEGCVRSVSINGNNSFGIGDKFGILDEVIIEYDKGKKKKFSIDISDIDMGLIGTFLLFIVVFGLLILLSVELRELWGLS